MHVISWSLIFSILGKRRSLAQLAIKLPKRVESVVHYALGWTIPIVVVLCSIGLNDLLSPGIMDEGNDGRCWINGNEGILYWFSVSYIV